MSFLACDVSRVTRSTHLPTRREAGLLTRPNKLGQTRCKADSGGNRLRRVQRAVDCQHFVAGLNRPSGNQQTKTGAAGKRRRVVV